MDERTLLLLGLLKGQSQHGYQISEFIEHNLSLLTDMKKSTAYAVLDRLARDGYVSTHTEQPGNRPPRKVYSITEAGEQLFLQQLRESLATRDTFQLKGDIGLMFADRLPLWEVIEGLEKRLYEVEKEIAHIAQMPMHKNAVGVELALEHMFALLLADQAWLQRTIAHAKRLIGEGQTRIDVHGYSIRGEWKNEGNTQDEDQEP